MNKIEPKWYKVEKCSCCGKEFKNTQGSTYRSRCNSCIEKDIERLGKIAAEIATLKMQLMHENAIRKIETCRHAFRFCDLLESIAAIEEMEKMKPESFNSASEIVAAIGLYHEGFFFKINHKMLTYTIDFYMPDEKICLEIDGDMHDIGNTRYKDGRRDIELRNALGSEWEVVRIPTTYSDRFPFNIGDRAIEVANKQRELRKKNQGHLPRGYSKSVDAYYAKVFD